MRKLRIAHDRRIKDVFVELFSQLPGAEGNVEDSAQAAYAILFGLRGNSFYDPQLSPAQANRLFKQTLFRLAGLRAVPPREPHRALTRGVASHSSDTGHGDHGRARELSARSASWYL